MIVDTLTIFTPTYNRVSKLKRLKASLDQQTDLNFTWLVVDDGSTDKTEEYFDSIKENTMYCVLYFKQDNRGKHAAHNFAVQKCRTELFFCVDSDDSLPDYAVQRIKEIWGSINDKESLSGIVGNKAYFDYKIIGNAFPNGIQRSTLGKLYEVYGKNGDTALVWRTDIIKEYPFMIFGNEKFLRESTAYWLIDKKYNLYVTNDILYLVEYCDDGLTRNATALEFNNPKGAAYYRLCKSKQTKGIKKIIYLSAYTFFLRRAQDLKLAKKELGHMYYFYFLLSYLIQFRYRIGGHK